MFNNIGLPLSIADEPLHPNLIVIQSNGCLLCPPALVVDILVGFKMPLLLTQHVSSKHYTIMVLFAWQRIMGPTLTRRLTPLKGEG